MTDMVNGSAGRGPGAGRSRKPWLLAIGAVVVVIIVVVVVVVGTSSSTTDTPSSSDHPAVTISPSSSGYRDGQTVTVSVGPNKYFAPYSRIIIIQCADAGGSTANLPTSSLTCDGNTVSGHSVLVNKDGSFSTPYFVMYSLPNSQLGEEPSNEPVCNATHQCVLFVGENQNDFTQPKVFSEPFRVQPVTDKGGSS